MKFTIDISMSNGIGVLERILGRLRQRCFEVCHLIANCSADGMTIDARITVESSRRIEPMIKQLYKLHDVSQVRLHHCQSALDPDL